MMRQNSLEGEYQIVLPSEISSSIVRTIVDARSFYMNSFLYSKLRYRFVQRREVEEAKEHQMVMLKEVI